MRTYRELGAVIAKNWGTGPDGEFKSNVIIPSLDTQELQTCLLARIVTQNDQAIKELAATKKAMQSLLKLVQKRDSESAGDA